MNEALVKVAAPELKIVVKVEQMSSNLGVKQKAFEEFEGPLWQVVGLFSRVIAELISHLLT